MFRWLIAVLELDIIRDRRWCADMLFIRAPSTIRADGATSAQERVLQFDVSSYVDRY